MLFKFFITYLIIINIVSAITTIYDKYSAIKHKWRVSEKALLLLSILGGSVSMLFTMNLIRHKTKKPLFMIGIPVIVILQLALLYLISVNL